MSEEMMMMMMMIIIIIKINIIMIMIMTVDDDEAAESGRNSIRFCDTYQLCTSMYGICI